jgi:glycosyltransferase involved in cell wall biosynthesis
MRVSVVTVCYNSAATIGDTLQSVAAQSHPDVEHIVIDGGSADGTQDVVRQRGAHVAQFVSERDRGIYDGMNKGLARATGDVVGFLNSDDMFAGPEALATISAAFADDRIDAVYGDLVFVDPVDTSRVVRFWQPGEYQPRSCRSGWMPPHPTFYVRRALLQANRPFDLEFRLQADFELILRLFEVVKIRSRYLPQTLVRMRVGGATTGSWRNIVRGNLEAARASRKNGFRGGPLFMMSKMLRRVPQFLARPAPHK